MKLEFAEERNMSLKSEIGICKILKYDPKSEIKIYETAIYYYNWT